MNMPLFPRQPETAPGDRRVLTVNLRPQPHPEAPGSMPRRGRLFIECVRRLADDPLAGPSATGQPIGDGCGLEGLVAKVAPLFERERSLIRWVALRGAFTELFVRVFDPASAIVSPGDLEQVMGLEWTSDLQGEFHPKLAQPWRTKLSPDQQQAAFGIASSVFVRVEDYGRYSRMNVTDVNADPRCRIPQAAALDCIAWSSIALLRLEIAQQLFPQVPEPDALSEPGWYIDPLFAKSERFWDGSDWTARCRVKDGRQFIETNIPLA
jgi:Protein of unknown function (DUF2510)